MEAHFSRVDRCEYGADVSEVATTLLCIDAPAGDMLRPRDSGLFSAPKVLVLDDDPIVLDVLARSLSRAGFDVSRALTGKSALDLVLTSAFDALLLDVRVPDMDGLTVLAQIRAAGREDPAIVISGVASVDDAVAAMKLGAADVLAKPLDIPALIRAIFSIVRSRRQARRPHWNETPHVRELCLAVTIAFENNATMSAPLIAARRRLRSVLVRILARNDVTACEFVMCADTLRFVETTFEAPLVQDLLNAVLTRLDASVKRVVPQRLRTIDDALAVLGADDGSGLQLSEAELGRRVGVAGPHLGRLLHCNTSFTFRQWRRAFRMRCAVRLLVETDEHIRQIAFRACYNDNVQFNHEFKQLFGISPRGFRQASKAQSES